MRSSTPFLGCRRLKNRKFVREELLATRWISRSEFSVHKNGDKKWDVEFKDGREHGKGVVWYENGRKKSEAMFTEGELVGSATWYESGQKESEATYREGRSVLNSCWDTTGKQKPCDPL